MTPRPRKPRICECPYRPPGSQVFKPAGIPLKDLERVELHQDELEALRLCDKDGLTQAEAGVRMEVSRGTVQRLVTRGRHKIITAVVECRALLINLPEEPK